MSEAAAHAKVNLRHRVFAADETGHHGVETVLARTSLHDTVTLEETASGIRLELDGEAAEGVPADETNLCVRAAAAFVATAFPRREPPGMRLGLVKRIPPGAGLGGGSADAAATLRLLSGRWPRLDERALLALAGSLGSDVPFALLDVPLALGWERGRRLLPLRPPRPRPALLVGPPFPVATAEAYGWLRETRAAAGEREAGGAAALPGAARWSEWKVLERLVRNDLEEPVTRRHPEIAACLDALRPMACAATMTGSGSTVVAWFADEGARRAAVDALAGGPAAPERGWRLFEVELPV